jgi:hypothetical protein
VIEKSITHLTFRISLPVFRTYACMHIHTCMQVMSIILRVYLPTCDSNGIEDPTPKTKKKKTKKKEIPTRWLSSSLLYFPPPSPGQPVTRY